MIEKPDKLVASAIKTEFDKNNFLINAHSTNIAEKLSNGTITEEDWKLMAELSLEKIEGESDAQKN